MIDRHLPLTDLHRHLDGNIRLSTILDLARQFNVNLPGNSLDTLKPHVQVVETEPSLVAFLAKLDWMVAVLGDYEAVRRVAYENVEDVVKAGIDYAELRFSPGYMAMSHRLHPQGVVEAVIDGVQQANRDLGVHTQLIGILSRTFGVEACQRELDAILSQRDHMVAVDLAGDELGFPGALFKSQFAQVRDSGLNITIHAGEAAGPEAIWFAIDELGADRIGHGVKAIEDPRLMDTLAERRIGIESCPTSNIQTSTVGSYKQHPIGRFLDHGLLISLNTDDPGISDIEIDHEYGPAARQLGLSREQLLQLQHNGLAMAYLSDTEKQQLQARCRTR